MKETISIMIMLIICTHVSISQNTNLLQSSNSSQAGTYKKIRFGGYGEVLYQRMNYGNDRYNYKDGSQPVKRAVMDIPRLVLSLDYKFNPKFIFTTEIEFEHGGTGAATEIEYEEFGEYETEIEKGGEVVLEQMHLTYKISRAFNIRAGHMIVPVGITNGRHLPTQYFGTIRPEGENTIIPLTWHETGLSILGSFNKWRYEAMVINGLDANGFSSSAWIKKGRQTAFEQMKATDLAFAFRLENNSIKGLRLGGSLYVGNSTANTAKPEKMKHISGQVLINSFEFEYKRNNIWARGNYIGGKLGDSEEISRINKGLSTNSPYPRTPIAKQATTYAIEAGYNILSFTQSAQKLYPFVRYEYYNTMQTTEGKVFADPRHKRDVLTLGVNYFMLPNLVLKADYSIRNIDGGNYNQENTFALSLGYSAWFFQK